MSSTPYAVEIINLGKRYANVRGNRGPSLDLRKFYRLVVGGGERSIVALDGVSFNVEQGAVFGLLGANGAGKTTLMKILSTLVTPDSGKALVHGVSVAKNARKITRLLQTVLAEGVGFERRLTGRENLELFASLYGLPKKEARTRIDELIEFSGLTERADTMFQKYSTGMSRKLLVCRALLSNAKVLLFDEPTSGLDPISAVDFRRLLKDILSKERGKTIVLSTHNLWEAQQICDRMALLRKGKLIMTGTPSEIRATVSDKLTLSIVVTARLVVSWSEVVRNLKLVDGVIEVEAIDKGNYGEMLLQIDGTRDINYSRVFETLSRMQLTITYLESSQPSLEEAFITLTNRSN